MTIARPRDEVFQYLADFANHAEFTDHYLRDWHLTRIDSVGVGSGARFKVKLPFNRFAWNDLTVVECEPSRIVAQGSGGKFNRTKSYVTWTLSPAPGNGTRVQYSYETEPALITDRIMESIGARRRLRKGAKKALQRLRRILEDDEARGKRATIAGVEPGRQDLFR